MSLELNIHYQSSNRTGSAKAKKNEIITLRASRLEVPDELCKEIHGKIGHKLKGNSSSYGLYSPSKKEWLENRTLIGATKIPSGSNLTYRPKERYMRLRFLDGTRKTVPVDETKYVKELVRDICVKLNIENPDEFSLIVAGDFAVSQHHPAMIDSPTKQSPKTLSKLKLRQRSETWGYHLRPPDSPTSLSPVQRRKNFTVAGGADIPKPSPPMSPAQRRKTFHAKSASAAGLDLPKLHTKLHKSAFGSWCRSSTSGVLKKQLSKRHQIRIDTPWLDPNKTLAEQEVTEEDELILMYRYYYHMELKSESINTEMLFKQARATYLAGELLCSMKDMIQFTALLCQIVKGDFDEDRFGLENLLKMLDQISPPKWKIKTYYQSIIAEYTALKGMTAAEVKCCFVKLWSSLELFGFEFLSCTEWESNRKGLIGISKDKVIFLSDAKSSKTNPWELDDLIDWKHETERDTVTLCFKQERRLQLYLPEYSGVLVDCIEGHKDLQSIVPGMSWLSQSFHFEKLTENVDASRYNFASQFARDRERCALSRFTYDDIFRISKTINPLFSDDELEDTQGPWENPLFENTDQLMDERFSFLDLKEYNGKMADGVPQMEMNGSLSAGSSSSSGDDDVMVQALPTSPTIRMARLASTDDSNM